MDKSKTLTFIVSEEEHKFRLDKFLSSKISEISRSKIQQVIDSGEVQINGKVIKQASSKVEINDEVSIHFEIVTETKITPKKLDLKIVFEDKDLIIIDKPIGLTVHPGAGNHNDTLVNALVYHCKDSLSKIGGDARPGIVHRLDRDTSGLMVIAKSDVIHAQLSEALKEREIKRTYQALIYGTLHPSIGSIKTGYGRSKRDRTKMTILRDALKEAITHYKVIKTFGDNTLSLVEFQLETGRTHQIRVHMEFKKTPVVGDQTYGRGRNYNLSNYSPEQVKQIKSFSRQALHAVGLTFTHPRTGEVLSFKSDFPDDIQKLISVIS